MDETDPPPSKKLKTEEIEDTVVEEAADPESDSEPEVIARIKETDVGITEYISSHDGFQGILKQRYSDFLVNEISEDGEILRLDDVAEKEEETEPEEEVDSSVLPDACVNELKKIAESPKEEDNVIIEVGEDKELRTNVHKAIRALKLPLESSTEVDEKGNRIIRVSKAKLSFGQKYAPPNRWPATRPNYCHFLLYKENRDTNHALDMIAKALRLRTSLFSFAGTKDKRAKTVQKVSAYRVPLWKLLRLNKWWRREILLGNCSYSKEVLRLGDQGGNHFGIVLRDVTGSDSLIELAMESLKTNGFVNYFGMQRFGTGVTPTHAIGKSLLKSNWAEAIDLILMANPGVNTQTAAWRKVWSETKDPDQALEAMDRRHGVEKLLLEGMRRYGPTDFVNSLDSIPRNTRTMYVHAYQSYIWNTVVSKRIAKYGLVPVVGDLVLSSKTRNEKHSGERPRTTVITDDNLNEFSIYDVVLPLPGYDIDFPRNDVKDLYDELLAEDGLKIEDMKHRVKNYSLPGAYRHLVVRPRDVAWRVLRYDDVTLPLLLSDADRLDGTAEEPASLEGGKFKALRLNLSLPPSTYATMAIREVLKTDTSSVHQASLNTK